MKEDCDPSELESLFGTSEDEKPTTTYFQKAKGLLAAFAWVPLFVTSAASVQLLQRQIPDFQLNTLRFGTAGILFAIGTLVVTNQCPIIPKLNIVSVVGFAMFTFCGTATYYMAVIYASLSLVQSIYLSSCIVSGITLFRIFLDEKITLRNILFGIICCCGVMLVIQPDVIFQGENTSIDRGHLSRHIPDLSVFYLENNGTENQNENEEANRNKDGVILGCVLAAISGLSTTCNLILVKKLSFLQEHKMKTLFWSYGICTILSAIVMAIFEKPSLPVDDLQYLYVSLHCTTYVLQWPLYMFAARYISGTTINIIVATSVVFMLIPQYTLLSSILPGKGNWIEIVGVFLVLLGPSSKSLTEFCSK